MPRYQIAFWNLENLFAPEGHPGREPWIADAMRGDLAGWTPALFDTKLRQLGAAIAAMNGGAGPDILGFCEVENRFCVDALLAELTRLLPARAYAAVHADATLDRRGIDTGFIYDFARLSVDSAAVFSHFVMRRTGTRDITQATFRTVAGREFVCFANHWPSRSGGHASESAGYRATAGETLNYWHMRVRETKGVDIPIIAMGDFNDDPADLSITIHADATRERDDVLTARTPRFYNLAWNQLRQDVLSRNGRARTLYGTLYFQGNANVFDQILVSASLLRPGAALRVVEDTARIEALPDMVSNSKNEGPIRFGLPKGDAAKNVDVTGYADHFPVSVVVEET